MRNQETVNVERESPPADSPEQVHELFCRYMREGDVAAVLTLYDPGIVFCNRSGELKAGHEAIRPELEPMAAAKTEFSFAIRRKIVSGDIALVHNEWTMAGPPEQRGYAVEVFRRQADGGWRFLIGDPFTVGGRSEG
jgi:ketosteroid isomerase-like protein